MGKDRNVTNIRKIDLRNSSIEIINSLIIELVSKMNYSGTISQDYVNKFLDNENMNDLYNNFTNAHFRYLHRNKCRNSEYIEIRQLAMIYLLEHNFTLRKFILKEYKEPSLWLSWAEQVNRIHI
jgi:hypothetical protein